MNRQDIDKLAKLGSCLALAEEWDRALVIFEKVVKLDPHQAYFRQALGTVYMALGRNREAIHEYRRCLLMKPALRMARENLIFLLDLDPTTTYDVACEARQQWWRTIGLPIGAHDSLRPRNLPDPERPLRVGYVSADVRRHSAAFVFGPVVLRHTRAVQAFVYSSTPLELHDDMTAIFKARTTWREAAGLSDEALASQIAADGIDVLVDLSGYSYLNRLRTFCLTPAPVQVTAWGYATGLGLPVIPYLFADDFVVPASCRAYFTEEIIELPCVVAYQAPPYAPEVNGLPALTGAPFTFGSLNRAQKVSDTALDLWAAVLRLVPGSRLIVKDGSYELPGVAERIRRAFTVRGVDPARLEIRGKTDQAVHMATYHEIDLVLDSWPAGGGVTALEGLWMGVPVITLTGERIPSRVSGSLLMRLGLPDFITNTPEDYVTRAIQWASADHVHALAAVRRQLRIQMQQSPMCRGYVAAVEAAYRTMWRRWCAEMVGR
jgi:protein O-GlcNAc transferase